MTCVCVNAHLGTQAWAVRLWRAKGLGCVEKIVQRLEIFLVLRPHLLVRAKHTPVYICVRITGVRICVQVCAFVECDIEKADAARSIAPFCTMERAVGN